MGYDGEYLVALSVATWLEEGYSLEDISSSFYARASPTTSSLSLAYLVTNGMLVGDGKKYCVSKEDAYRLNLQVDEWSCIDQFCLGRSVQWVRAR